MNRRKFLAALGSVTAVGATGTSVAARPASAHGSSPVSLQNRSSTLSLIAGEKGYGIDLATLTEGKMQSVGGTPFPIRTFYGVRGGGPITDVAFSHAVLTGGELKASATFIDSKSNRWRVAFTAEPWGTAGFRCRYDYELLEGAAKDVFFEHSLRPAMPPRTDQTYVLMPGLLYDGNRLADTTVCDNSRCADMPHFDAHGSAIPITQLPQLTAAQNFQVDTPVLTLSTPVAAFYERASGRTLMIVTEPTTQLDMSGFSCVMRPEDYRISLMIPIYREKHYHTARFEPEVPKGATVGKGGRFSVPVIYLAEVHPDIPALFAALQPVRQVVRKPFVRTKKLPISAAAALVETNFNTRQWCADQFYINAMEPDYDIATSGCGGLTHGWQLLTGWAAGAITGYALLKMGSELSQKRARTMLDLIARTGVSPSGLFWSNYANGQWDPAVNNLPVYQHLRMPADAAYYYLRSLELERTRGLEHPDWEKAVASNLDAFTRLWNAHQDFGHKIDRNTLEIVEPGSASGALCIGGLALGSRLPNGREYAQVASAAAEAFYQRFVRTGWIAGGPLDIPVTADSESATALLESYVTLYEVTRDARYLQYATDTAHLLATWVVAYNAPFPRGTVGDKMGFQTVGGVLANTQNHHIGPSFATNSGSLLLRLYQYTGDAAYLRLLEDVITSLLQYVCTGKEGYQRMKPGMVTEQVNMSDELGKRGDVWEISASWAETNVLLSSADVPSVYIDRERNTLGVFDHIEAHADWKGRTLQLSNPTLYPATVRVQKGMGDIKTVVIAPAAAQTLGLD
jgi:hypothetical protein